MVRESPDIIRIQMISATPEPAVAYLVPDSLDDAFLALRDGGSRIVAGCTDFFPALGDGPPPGTILDISGLTELRGVSGTPAGWRIGAATTWSELIGTPLPPAFDALKAAAREVGSVQIQNAGTVAGNICNASPAADGVPPLLALDASVELSSARGSRILPLDRFITGVRRVDLAEGELVTALHVPAPPENASSAFLKLGSRRYLVISISMAAVVASSDEDGRIVDARVAVGACSPVAQRLRELEADLVGRSFVNIREAGLPTPAQLSVLSPISDARATAAYRLQATAEICRRALQAVLSPDCKGHE